jgi:hypothetical protein
MIKQGGCAAWRVAAAILMLLILLSQGDSLAEEEQLPVTCIIIRTFYKQGGMHGDGSLRRLITSLQAQTSSRYGHKRSLVTHKSHGASELLMQAPWSPESTQPNPSMAMRPHAGGRHS